MPPRSRASRHQDAVAARNRQGQVLDLDPMDGLPVQKWSLQTTRINQDATSSDPSVNNPRSTTSAEWAAQFDTPQYPWPEQPLPSFLKDLPPWNQELIRRARCGNTNPKLSEWDRQKKCWTSAADAEKKYAVTKSHGPLEVDQGSHVKHEHDDAEDVTMHKSDESSEASDEDNANKSELSDEDMADEGAPFKISTNKRRKLRLNDSPEDTRTIDIRRWQQLPATLVDHQPERSFLAPRRAGMAPLYRSELTARLFAQYDSANLISTGISAYDLGEGGGLSNAAAVTNPGAVPGAGAPVRKNIPPRRMKKKKGGPGRKKIIRDPVPSADGVVQPTVTLTDATGQNADGIVSENPAPDTIQPEIVHADSTQTAEEHDNEDEAGSGSEAEGSEEGEIDEGSQEQSKSQTTQQPAPEDPSTSTSTSTSTAIPGLGSATPPAAAPAEPAASVSAAASPQQETTTATATATAIDTTTPPQLETIIPPQPLSPAPPASNPFGESTEPEKIELEPSHPTEGADPSADKMELQPEETAATDAGEGEGDGDILDRLGAAIDKDVDENE